MTRLSHLLAIGILAMTLGCNKKSKTSDGDKQPEGAPTAPAAPGPVTVSISCGALGLELELCKEGAEAWAKQTGNKINVVSTPNSATERLALYQQMLAAQAAEIDVYQVDVVWPGILANHLLDLKPYSKGIEASHYPAIIRNNTVKDKLVALPWFIDAGVLYYRKDLLEKYQKAVPATWAELATTAKAIQDGERKANDKMWGFVWQGKAYEGLTCNAIEWVASYGGGSIVDEAGEITINSPKAIEAINTAASWIGTITPKGVLNYGEEEARGSFQIGNAVFMRNWPYAWSLSQSDDSAVKGKVGVAALPKGGDAGQHAAALGGQQLAVSKYSKHPAAAADLVLYLTSEAEQKRRAIKGSVNPTYPALYKDAEVLTANPFFAELSANFSAAVPRPSTVTGNNYNRVSNAFWEAVHAVLSGSAKADTSVPELATKLDEIRRNGQW